MMSGLTASAHHSFTATYDEAQTVKIEGELVQFMFRNPHAWVHVMAPDENGVMQRWGVEWGGAGALAGQGVTRDSLKPGDKVVITGNPGRNPVDQTIMVNGIHFRVVGVNERKGALFGNSQDDFVLIPLGVVVGLLVMDAIALISNLAESDKAHSLLTSLVSKETAAANPTTSFSSSVRTGLSA